MPSFTQTMAATPRVFATEKRTAKLKPSLIMVDNVLGAQNAVITVIDRFTPSVTNGVPIPVAQAITRLSINVSMAACVSIQDELKDVKAIGQLDIGIGIADANCIVTVAYDYE